MSVAVSHESSGPVRPLRVLYIMHNASRGGSSTSLLALLESLPPGEVEPLVLCPDGPMVEAFEAAGIARRRIPAVSMFYSIAGVPLRGARLLTLLRTVWDLRHNDGIAAVIRDFRPDIVHLNDGGMVSAARTAARARVPVVMHVRALADRESKWFGPMWSSLVSGSVTRFVPIDESVARSIPEVGRHSIVYNPLRRRRALDVSTARARSRAEDTRVRVVFLTGLNVFKGIWDVAECAKRLRDRDDIVFVIAGENSRPAEFHRSAKGAVARRLGLVNDVETDLRAWIEREGLGDRIQLTGHVEDVDAVLADADMLVFPSRLNGVGRSVFEAGTLGIPSIVTLRDPVQDIVVHETTGLIVGEGDIDGLAAAIRRLTDDAELRRRLGANAREKYRVQFDPTRIGRQVAALYRSVLSQRAVS